MDFAVTWSPSARLDLKEIHDYIALDKPTAADRFVSNVIAAVERLSDFPLSGRVVPEFADPTIREVLKGPVRIVYRIRQPRACVEIARVWYSVRGDPEL